MIINDGGGTPRPRRRRKAKSVTINSPSNPMENRPSSGSAGAGNRGGHGTSGRQAPRNSNDPRHRDSRRVDKPTKPVSPPKPKPKPKPKAIPKSKATKKPKKVTKAPAKKPTPPSKPNTAALVKTVPTVIPVGEVTVTNTWSQEQDILNAFLALSGSELFQYTNERSIDGMFSDVSIMSVLSSRRQEYTANEVIESVPPVIQNVYREGGILYVDIVGGIEGRQFTLQFFKTDTSTKIGSVDYV